jgi:trans-aconitate methyltransferase
MLDMVLERDAQYWNDRYAHGGTSGEGSYNELEKKVRLEAIARFPEARTVLDVGCGDISHIADILRILPNAQYTGIDISSEIIMRNRARNIPRCRFVHAQAVTDYEADLVLCFDVLYHISDQAEYDRMLENLNQARGLLIIVYNESTINEPSARHVIKRKLAPFRPFEEVVIPSENRQKSLYISMGR